MEDLRHLFRCAGLGEQCAEALAAGGWSVARLGTLHGGGIGLRNALQAACRARVSGFDIDDADLVAVVQMAHGWSEAARKVEAKRGASSWLEAHERHEREVRRKLLQARELEDISEKVTAKGLAKRARWPSRLGKKIALAGDDIGLREAARACTLVKGAEENFSRSEVASEHPWKFRWRNRSWSHSEGEAGVNPSQACQDMAESGKVALQRLWD